MQIFERTASCDVFEDLVTGIINPDDLPPIAVSKHKGEWMSFDGNRRLYLYQKLQENHIIDTIPVTLYPGSKKITAKEHVPLVVRGDKHIDN